MSDLPSWVRRGAKCRCIDSNWRNTYDIPSTGPFPQEGEDFTVAGVGYLLGVWYIIVAEQSVAPDHYGVSAFRPLTERESDAAIFGKILKDASVGRRRALEPAR